MKKGHPSKNPFPPPKGKAAPVAEPSSDDEEDSDVEADGDLSDAASWTTEQIMESCTVTRNYLKDPLKAFLSNPEISLSAERLNGLYAARAVVAKEIDPLLGPKGPFAEEFRSIERQRLSSMKERLFALRRNLSRKEVKALDPSELKLEGTGLMWATGLHNVSESVQHGTTIPIEFTELDEDIFNHCIDVETGFIDNDPFKGMQYTFFFAANPYFSNTELRCSLHFASAYLSLERFGVEPSFISAVTSDTPVQWLNKGQFESLPEEDVNPHERKLRDTLVSVFLGEDLPASVANDVKTLMMMWPRPLFTLLFNTNTSVDAKSALQNALFSTTTASGKTVFDDTPGGPASIKAAALEMSPLVKLWRALEATVRAPMINILDSQKDVLDADDYGDDEEEEEEEESDDDSDESDDSDVKHKAKQHRAENPTKKPPPPDCKQQ